MCIYSTVFTAYTNNNIYLNNIDGASMQYCYFYFSLYSIQFLFLFIFKDQMDEIKKNIMKKKFKLKNMTDVILLLSIILSIIAFFVVLLYCSLLQIFHLPNCFFLDLKLFCFFYRFLHKKGGLFQAKMLHYEQHNWLVDLKSTEMKKKRQFFNFLLSFKA